MKSNYLLLLTNEEIERAESFSQYLKEWQKSAMEKFINGIIEHRNEPPIDPEKEIEQEIMDILAYQHLKKYYNEKK